MERVEPFPTLPTSKVAHRKQKQKPLGRPPRNPNNPVRKFHHLQRKHYNGRTNWTKQTYNYVKMITKGKGAPCKIWSMTEKKQLLDALKKYSHQDWGSICKSVPTRTLEEIKELIHQLKGGDNLKSRLNRDIQLSWAPIESWLDMGVEMVHYEQSDLSKILSRAFSIMGNFSQFSPSSSPSLEPDYGKLYHYLAAVMDESLSMPELTPLESAIVADLMHSIGDKLRMSDTSLQRKVMCWKYKMLNHKFDFDNVGVTLDRIRKALTNDFSDLQKDGNRGVIELPSFNNTNISQEASNPSDASESAESTRPPAVELPRPKRRGRPAANNKRAEWRRQIEKPRLYAMNPFCVPIRLLHLKPLLTDNTIVVRRPATPRSTSSSTKSATSPRSGVGIREQQHQQRDEDIRESARRAQEANKLRQVTGIYVPETSKKKKKQLVTVGKTISSIKSQVSSSTLNAMRASLLQKKQLMSPPTTASSTAQLSAVAVVPAGKKVAQVSSGVSGVDPTRMYQCVELQDGKRALIPLETSVTEEGLGSLPQPSPSQKDAEMPPPLPPPPTSLQLQTSGQHPAAPSPFTLCISPSLFRSPLRAPVAGCSVSVGTSDDELDLAVPSRRFARSISLHQPSTSSTSVIHGAAPRKLVQQQHSAPSKQQSAAVDEGMRRKPAKHIAPKPSKKQLGPEVMSPFSSSDKEFAAEDSRSEGFESSSTQAGKEAARTILHTASHAEGTQGGEVEFHDSDSSHPSSVECRESQLLTVRQKIQSQDPVKQKDSQPPQSVSQNVPQQLQPVSQNKSQSLQPVSQNIAQPPQPVIQNEPQTLQSQPISKKGSQPVNQHGSQLTMPANQKGFQPVRKTNTSLQTSSPPAKQKQLKPPQQKKTPTKASTAKEPSAQPSAGPKPANQILPTIAHATYKKRVRKFKPHIEPTVQEIIVRPPSACNYLIEKVKSAAMPSASQPSKQQPTVPSSQTSGQKTVQQSPAADHPRTVSKLNKPTSDAQSNPVKLLGPVSQDASLESGRVTPSSSSPPIRHGQAVVVRTSSNSRHNNYNSLSKADWSVSAEDSLKDHEVVLKNTRDMATSNDNCGSPKAHFSKPVKTYSHDKKTDIGTKFISQTGNSNSLKLTQEPNGNHASCQLTINNGNSSHTASEQKTQHPTARVADTHSAVIVTSEMPQSKHVIPAVPQSGRVARVIPQSEPVPGIPQQGRVIYVKPQSFTLGPAAPQFRDANVTSSASKAVVKPTSSIQTKPHPPKSTSTVWEPVNLNPKVQSADVGQKTPQPVANVIEMRQSVASAPASSNSNISRLGLMSSSSQQHPTNSADVMKTLVPLSTSQAKGTKASFKTILSQVASPHTSNLNPTVPKQTARTETGTDPSQSSSLSHSTDPSSPSPNKKLKLTNNMFPAKQMPAAKPAGKKRGRKPKEGKEREHSYPRAKKRPANFLSREDISGKEKVYVTMETAQERLKFSVCPPGTAEYEAQFRQRLDSAKKFGRQPLQLMMDDEEISLISI